MRIILSFLCATESVVFSEPSFSLLCSILFTPTNENQYYYLSAAETMVEPPDWPCAAISLLQPMKATESMVEPPDWPCADISLLQPMKATESMG